MSNERINIVWVVAPYVSQKLAYVRKGVWFDRDKHPNCIVVDCDKILSANSHTNAPVFILVAMIDGAKRVCTYHNVICAEVIYDESTNS